MSGLHDFEARITYYQKRIRESPEIIASNKKAIADFLTFCASIEHPKGPLSTARIAIYTQRLYQLGVWLKKDFHEATKEDLVQLADFINRQPISQGTKNFYYVSLKKFYRWYEGEMTFFPKKIAWLRALKTESSVKPEDLINSKEALAMIDAASNLRDKALISVLHEGGYRIGEAAAMQIKNVSFDSKGVILTAPDGKTGMYYLRLVMINYLTDWLKMHPRKNEPDAPLFCALTRKDRGKTMKYKAVSVALKKLARRAGITKRMHPHIFRHSSITDDFRRNMNEQAVMKRHNIKDPETLRHYVKLAQRDTDDAYLRSRGLKEAVRVEDGREWFKCPRCARENELNTHFCAGCGAPLSTTAAVSVESDLDELRAVLPRLLKMADQWDALTQEGKSEAAARVKKRSA